MQQNSVLWVVDIQNDFMLKSGELHVPEAETIIPNVEAVINWARKNNIKVVFTADWHYPDSEEISHEPDYIETFPEHCMAETEGAKIINNLASGTAVMEWKKMYSNTQLIQMAKQEIVILKDAFDVFVGNPNTDNFIDVLNPSLVYLIGVAGNVCVDKAVKGFIKKNIPLIAFKNCIKDLPTIPSCINNWKENGVKIEDWNKDYKSKS
jgi:nicotinamidase/pyrazinamidase